MQWACSRVVAPGTPSKGPPEPGAGKDHGTPGGAPPAESRGASRGGNRLGKKVQNRAWPQRTNGRAPLGSDSAYQRRERLRRRGR
eukprot:scaffold3620_cov417-Prasinococcus_capsulatus_cf.AAC.1